MSLTHNSETAEGEPAWSEVDKTRLPDGAFADRGNRKYPHHWVQGGGDLDDDGRYTSGDMFLHRGGLNAAWGAAHGARSGQDALQSVISHLQAHRRALGIDEEESSPVLANWRTVLTSGRVLLDPVDAAGSSDRREYQCVFIQPGLVKRADQTPSKWLNPDEVVQRAAPLFNSVASYLDHPEMFGFGWRQEHRVENLVGVTFDACWSEAERAVTGGVRLYDAGVGSPGHLVRTLMDQILGDRLKGLEVPKVGLSAVLFLDREFDEELELLVTTDIRYVESVDFVYDAGAGGYVQAALAALQERPFRRVWIFPEGALPQDTPGGDIVSENETVGGRSEAPPEGPGPIPMDEALAAVERVAQRFEAVMARMEAVDAPVAEDPPTPPEPDPMQVQLAALGAQVEALTGALAAREEPEVVQHNDQPLAGNFLYGGMDGLEKVTLAVEALIDGVRPGDGIRPLTGIREAYHLLSGDYEMTGMFQPDRVYLANVTTATMASITANALNKRVINEYMVYPHWWEPACTMEDFTSLQDARWITLGGVGELPTVSEGAAYTELTWDDFVETDSFVKKGGYLGITLEAIDKDDTRRLQAAPRALAQAAWLTLGKSISAIFTTASGTGPTMSDSVVLFHANTHGNLLTTALSYSEWETVKIAMMKQTEVNSGERLGALTRPRFIWVPVDLETTALQILASEGEPGTADNDVNVNAQGERREERLRVARERVIVCPLWTDVNNWACQADPRLYPSIGLGFRYGRTPEIFSVASPTAGLMFSNDVLPVKVRFFFAVGPTDWRGLHKSNVTG